MLPRNSGTIISVWGLLSAGIGVLCAATSLSAVYFAEWDAFQAFLYTCLSCFGVALLCGAGRLLPAKGMSTRDAIFVVATGWALVSALGALPFIFSGALGPVGALFESVSGFTTTGSSVMRELDAAPRSLCLWRSVIHWTGGMGIILLLIAVLPYLGVGGKLLVLRESTGPSPKGIEPTAHETAMRLLMIYLGLTVLGIVAYMAAGMGFFEAINHGFSAISTGGFSTRYDSIASFNSLSIELVSIVIMLVGGVNFLMYYKLLTREWRGPLYDTELRVYLGIFAGATLLVAANLAGMQGNPRGAGLEAHAHQAIPFLHALRLAAFEVSTMMTDTGFVLANYDEWPAFSQFVLFIVTMTGGCVGSTAGGLKILRLVIIAHVLYNWLKRASQPKLVTAIRINSVVVDGGVMNRVMYFVALYVAWMTFGMLFMALTGLPFAAAASSVIATMNNCGPGLGMVGPTSDFSDVNNAGLLFLTANMLVGRLELVTFLAILLPAFWRRD